MKKEYPLVSIIVPVYNGENFIKASIETIFQQTYDNIELITIDDGSKDDSLRILQELAHTAKIQMQVVHQENAGICKTRNKGIDLANGEYIMFMDQDDAMYPDCVEQLVKIAEKKQTDLVIGGFDLVDNRGKILESWKLNPKKKFSRYRISAPWGRLYRKEILNQYHVRFMITKISEDFYFNMLYMSYTDKVEVTQYQGYCWLYNEKSESHANMSRLEEDRNPLIMLKQLHNDMNPQHNMDKDCVEYMMAKHIIWYLLYVAKSVDTNRLKEAYQQCFLWLKSQYPCVEKRVVGQLLVPAGENGRIRLIVRGSLLLNKVGLFFPLLKLYSKL